MSSPFIRRIVRIIIHSLQAVTRYTAFVLRSPHSPVSFLARTLFRTIILPIYQVLYRMKRAARKERRPFLDIIVGPFLASAVIVGGVTSGIIMNIVSPRTRGAENVGRNTILFTLTSDTDFPQEETIIVTPRKRPRPYYLADQRTLLWKIAAPFPEDEGLETQPIGAAPSTLPTTRRTPLVYRVRSGDTLSTIAARFGVSVETLLWENTLRITSLLRIGQELTILPASGISHTIARGDTLLSLARRYDVTVDDILTANGLPRTQTLILGQRLFIPGGRRFSIAGAPPRSAPLATRATVAPSLPALRTTRFFWPTTGRKLNQYFTWRHGGIDIDGDYTSPIYAADEGVITASGWGRGYGIYIDITHGDGYVTRYAHNSKNFVRVGERVKRGQLIGMIGSTGRSTGPHVHFEVLINGRKTNPLNYVR